MPTNRPLNPLPTWATDTNFPAGADPWDGTPTKVEPGAGLRASGFEPKQRPAAQHLNKELGQLGEWIKYMSLLQLHNYGEPTTTNELVQCITFDPFWSNGSRDGGWLGGTSTGKVEAYPSGGWADLGLTGGPNFITADSTGEANGIGGESFFGGGNKVYEYLANVFTNHTMPGTATIDVRKVKWDKYRNLLVVAGRFNTNAPAIWTAPRPFTTYTQRTVPSGFSADITMVACSPSVTLAVAKDYNGTNSGSWTSTDDITWTERSLSSPLIEEAIALAYGEEEGLFMLLTQPGKVYTSPDGISWTLKATTGKTFEAKTLAVNGSLWVAQGGSGFVGQMRYSTDSGATWRHFTPFGGTIGAGANWTDIRYQNGQIAFCDPITTTSRVHFSLKLSPDGDRTTP